MKATEFRIGNYHFYHIKDKFDERKEWDEVCQINADDLVWLSKPEGEKDRYYKPIPLTEEWFLKFGFKNNNMVFANVPMCYWGKNKIIIDESTNEIYLHNDKDQGIIVTCEYVHQLQNLYFALTNTELILQ